MRTFGRYRTTALVALIAFLPVVYRAFPDLALWAQVAVALAVALLAGYVEHQKSVAPQLSLADKRTYLFASACEPALEDLRRHDPTARLNIMEVNRGLLERFGSFEPVYTLGMEGDEDKDLRLRLRQGVCGQAVADGAFTAADLELESGPTFGLDADQLGKTRDLTTVMSMPVKKARKLEDGTFALTDEIVGVVNVDSKREGAYDFYRNTLVGPTRRPLLVEQEEVLGEISELCSYIMS